MREIMPPEVIELCKICMPWSIPEDGKVRLKNNTPQYVVEAFEKLNTYIEEKRKAEEFLENS